MRPVKTKKSIAHKNLNEETSILDFEPLTDDEAESFAEEFIASATSSPVRSPNPPSFR